ncbi:MAG TPA: CHASE3 domain-containing protein, partial [Abditibacteriaceae bacterium]
MAQLHVIQKLRLGFAAIAMLLLGLLLIVYVNLTRLSEAERWYTHTFQVLAETNQIGEDLVNMDTGARGYAITGDTSFLRPFKD